MPPTLATRALTRSSVRAAAQRVDERSVIWADADGHDRAESGSGGPGFDDRLLSGQARGSGALCAARSKLADGIGQSAGVSNEFSIRDRQPRGVSGPGEAACPAPPRPYGVPRLGRLSSAGMAVRRRERLDPVRPRPPALGQARRGRAARLPHVTRTDGPRCLLQRRSWWGSYGGTWGPPAVPGSVTRRSCAAALREAIEECAIDPRRLVLIMAVLTGRSWRGGRTRRWSASCRGRCR